MTKATDVTRLGHSFYVYDVAWNFAYRTNHTALYTLTVGTLNQLTNHVVPDGYHSAAFGARSFVSSSDDTKK